MENGFKVMIFFTFVLIILVSFLSLFIVRFLQDIYKTVIDIQVDLKEHIAEFCRCYTSLSSDCANAALNTDSLCTHFHEINDNVNHILSGYDEMTQNVIKLMFGNPGVHDE